MLQSSNEPSKDKYVGYISMEEKRTCYMGKGVVKEILSWILVFVIAIGVAYFINSVIIFRVLVPSGSMENTILINDKVITFRLAYLFHEPERGDIIVFPFPDDESQDYIKRIIGLPGETVEGKNGLVYINGKPLKEPYVRAALDSNFGPYQVPKGKYFMMGDNRNDSADSRFWNNKFVDKDKIKGKAILKWPKFTLFPKIKYN
jgi:signal peptidase I